MLYNVYCGNGLLGLGARGLAAPAVAKPSVGLELNTGLVRVDDVQEAICSFV